MQSRRLPALFWLVAGFILGVGFGHLAFRNPEPPPYVAPPFAVEAPGPRPAGPGLAEVEAEFARLGVELAREGDAVVFTVGGGSGYTVRVEARRSAGAVHFRLVPGGG